MQAVFLAGAALVLACQSVERLVFPNSLASLEIGIWVIIGSLVSAGVLVALQNWALKQDHSTAIEADRAHYMTDVAVNAAVLIALGITKATGWKRADPMIALMIACYIFWNARHIAKDVLLQLLDRELPDEDRRLIKETVLACEGVKNIHDLRTRYAGDRSFVEFHLEVDGGLTVDQGHAIGDRAEAAVAKALSGTTEVTCHLEPFGIDDERLDNRVRVNESKK